MTKLPTNEPLDRSSIADDAPLRLADAARLAFPAGGMSWLDIDKGTLERADKSTKDQGARDALPHPFASQEGAKATAQAMSDEWGRFTGQGLFPGPGDPSAVAMAPSNVPGTAPRSTRPSGRPSR